MENIEVSIENEEQVSEESKKVINRVTDDVSKNIEETNGELQTIENQIEEENVEKNDDEVVPSTTPKPTEEQENVIDTNTAVPASISPSRANVPLKEVNESEKEACKILVNGTENVNNKKRELDHEDGEIQEKILDNDERTGDPTKKIKITELTDASPVETKESENNATANGTTGVEV
jgi:hypothetical protein